MDFQIGTSVIHTKSFHFGIGRVVATASNSSFRTVLWPRGNRPIRLLHNVNELVKYPIQEGT